MGTRRHIYYNINYYNLPTSVFPQPVAIIAGGLNVLSVFRQIGRTNAEKSTSLSKRNSAISWYKAVDL